MVVICYLRSHKDRNPIYRMTFSKCICLRVYVAQRCPGGGLIILQLSEVGVDTRFVTKLMPVLFKESAPLYCIVVGAAHAIVISQKVGGRRESVVHCLKVSRPICLR